MAVDSFLRLDGIAGESTDAKHKDEIELLGFSWGVSNPGSPRTGTGGGAGKAVFEDLLVVARTSKASPRLFQACATGKHIPTAVLASRKAGGKQEDYFVLRLKEVLVSSYELETSEDDELLDRVALAFAQVELEYRPTGKTGKALAPVEFGWDLKKNAKV